MTIEYKDSKRISLLEADRTLRQGFDGGEASTGGSNGGCGGGGGASAVGANGVDRNGGNGGEGISNDITTSSVVYSSGGGGGSYNTLGGSGGTGGTGAGNGGGSGGAATGYGCGAGGGGVNANGSTGYQGIVILRFTTSGNGYSQAGGSVATSGSDTIITWTATSGTRTFTPTSAFNVRYLVVGGGGGSGGDMGGGAGAGGYLAGTSHAVTAQAYTIVVGAGGAANSGSTANNGTSGSNSSFDTLTSTGGGYGAGNGKAGSNGGSGGGCGRGNTTVGAGTSSDVTPTNVQDNSILVEKDTAKRYWRTGASGLTAQEQSSNAELQDLDVGAKGMGEYVRSTSSKLYGKILTDVQFYLKKGTPQAGAKVYARHYNSSDVLIHTYWEKLASDLPTSLTWTTETTLSGDTAYANGDYFVIEYTKTDGTSATGSVQTNRKDSTNANQWDGSNSGFINTYFGSSSYLDTGNMDIWFKGTTATPATWTRQLPTPIVDDNFSSDNYTHLNSNTSVSGGKLLYAQAAADNRAYRSITEVQSTFIIEWETVLGTANSGHRYHNLVLSEENTNVKTTSSNDGYTIVIDGKSGSVSSVYIQEIYSGTVNQSSAVNGSIIEGLSQSATHYFRFSRSGNVLTVESFSDSARTVSEGSGSLTLASTSSGFVFLQHGTENPSTTVSGVTIDNLKIYNGVSDLT